MGFLRYTEKFLIIFHFMFALWILFLDGKINQNIRSDEIEVEK